MQLDPLLVLKRLATGYDIKCLRVAAPLPGWRTLTMVCTRHWIPSLIGRHSANC